MRTKVNRTRVIWSGILLVILYLVFESLIHALILDEGFHQVILTPGVHEGWHRLALACLLFIFGIYAQYNINKLQEAKKKVKSAYSELDKTNKELEQIFQTAADGMRIVDKDFNILRINKTLLKMSGASKNEAINQKCYETFKGDFCFTNKCPLKQILNGNEYVELEVEKEGKNGRKIPCLVTATPFRDGDGKIIGIVEDFKDLSILKNAEKALKESEKEYRTVVENASEGIVVTQDGMLKFVNDAASKISGYSKEELLSTPFMEFVHPEDRELVKEHHRKRIKGEEGPIPYKMRVVSKKGDIIWLRNNGVLIDWEGKPATLNFLTDITEQKKAEENSKTAIEQLVDNLKQFDKSADRLRNPLAIITSALELKEMYDTNHILNIVDEQTKRIEKELDKLREEEIKTYELVKPTLESKYQNPR